MLRGPHVYPVSQWRSCTRGSDTAHLSGVSGAVFMAYMPLCTCQYSSGPKNADLVESWLIAVLPEKFRYCKGWLLRGREQDRALT